METTVISLGSSLSNKDFKRLTNSDLKVKLSKTQEIKVTNCRKILNSLNKREKPVYGVSTGFGHLQNSWIAPSEQQQLQINLIRSHAIGTGNIVPISITRTAMILLANSLSKGHSGIKLDTLRLLIKMINRSLIPVTYSIGSLGASGDLAPLAHLALVLIGEGKIHYKGKPRPTAEVFKAEGLNPIELHAKEGLALINGSHLVTAYAIHILVNFNRYIRYSLLASALSVEALRGTDKSFDQRIASLRSYHGHQVVSRAMRKLLHDSKIIKSHEDPKTDHKTQDAYSLRCIPQVMGAVWDAACYLERIVEIEVNSVTDNPLIFPDENEIISGGNFHGEPLGFPLETIKMAMIELANITEARISRLVSPFTSELPTFLASKPGIESGYMIAHYTVAALVNKLRASSQPNVTDNIPVSGSQEDHVSMAMNTATTTWEILKIVEKIVAFELMIAVRGLNLVKRPQSSPVLEETVKHITESIGFDKNDHVIQDKLEKVENILHFDSLLSIIEKHIDLLLPNVFNSSR